MAGTPAPARRAGTAARRREGTGRLVAAGAVLLQPPHDDPVQFAPHELAEPLRVAPAVGRDRGRGLAQRSQARARPGRLLLPDDPPDLVVPGRPEPLPVERGS